MTHEGSEVNELRRRAARALVDTTPTGDPLRDDPATTKSEITEHGDGVRWSFAFGDAPSAR